MKKDQIVYSIKASEVKQVAEEELNRKLTDEEMKQITGRIGDYINWREAVSFTLSDIGLKREDKEKE